MVSRILGATLVPIIAAAIMVPLIVGIGTLLLSVGHLNAIFVALTIMVAITLAAVIADRLTRPAPAGAAAAAAVPVGKFVWRSVLGLAFLAIVAITFYLTFAWIQIAHLYPTVGLVVIVSGIIGTPALIGLIIAALLLRPRWA
ncbi:MAG: hypothetical protein KatS3mg061_0352 [Dehalococcoidia bacterium]|nr:MAG: hypothetical protein KatS3mg061_0352 [Dehalococcoidia bacterium]